MRALALALCFVATPAVADDWTKLDNAGITQALTGRSLDYGNATQDFRASGATDFFSGRPSTGSWAVRGDQYCSVWPPSDQWTCYDVDASTDGTRIRFRSAQGSDVSVGVYIGSK